jgi:glycine betaine catabolism B
MLQRFKSKLLEKTYLTEDVILLKFERPSDFSYKAGQFVNIRIEREGKMRMRAYSILSPNTSKTLDFCVKIIEDGFASKQFEEANVLDEFEIIGPFGHFEFNENTSKHVFIGAGTGVAPFYGMLFESFSKTKEFSLIMSYRKKENILFDLEFKELAKNNNNFDYKVTLTKEDWDGLTGRVQNHLNMEIEDTTFYICGLKELVLETKELLISKGVTSEFIKVERYN